MKKLILLTILLMLPLLAFATYNPNYFGSSFTEAAFSNNFTVSQSVVITSVKLRVSLTMTSGNLGNIRIILTHDQGLFTEDALAFDYVALSGTTLTNAIFNDAAASAITSGSSPYTGEWKANPGWPMSSFVTGGRTTNGTWTLIVQPDFTEPHFTVSAWDIELNGGGALPVEMTSFTATGTNNQVVLNWRTESETNNSHFNLYRSTTRDERGELISRVNGNGTTANANSYRYVDANVLNGTTYYYHISDVALDGAEHMNSFVVSATPALHATGEVPFKYSLVQNFPNPFNPSTTITYGIHKAGMVKLSVFNEMGREVATLVNGTQSPNTYKVEFNASNLPSGTYYYTLSTEDFTTTKKMVLTK